jgi:hypothetical protein
MKNNMGKIITRKHGPIIVDNRAVSREDLAKMASGKQVFYSKMDDELFADRVPHTYRKAPFNSGNREANLEANQLLVDFLIKIDYSAARMKAGLVDEKLDILGQLLEELDARPNITSPRDSLQNIFELKERCSEALRTTVALMNLKTRNIRREPDYEQRKGNTYDPIIADQAIANLAKKFGEQSQIFMCGSFVRKDKTPSDIDFRVGLPVLLGDQYEHHIAYASKAGTLRPFPITFMLIPEKHLYAFTISEIDRTMSPEESILANYGCSYMEAGQDDLQKMELVKVLMRGVMLREALADLSKYAFPARMKSYANMPYYAMKTLAKMFGTYESPQSVAKLSEEEMVVKNPADIFIEANLKMQEILSTYFEQITVMLNDKNDK